MAQLLVSAQQLLEIYIDKILSKPTKSKVDPNQVLPTVLMEGRNLFSILVAAPSKNINNDGQPAAVSPKQVALVICAMETSIQSISGNIDAEVALYRTLSKVSCWADCLLGSGAAE